VRRDVERWRMANNGIYDVSIVGESKSRVDNPRRVNAMSIVELVVTAAPAFPLLPATLTPVTIVVTIP
jgi:hypothetical protein